MRFRSYYLTLLACVSGIVISCKKTAEELPFPETEEQWTESLKTTAAIDAAADVIIEKAVAKADRGKLDVNALAQELKTIEGVQAATVMSDELIVIKQNDGIHINVFLDSYLEDEEDSEEGAAFVSPMKEVQGTRAADDCPRISSTATVNDKEIVFPGEKGMKWSAQILVPGYDYFVNKSFGRKDQFREDMILSWRDMIEDVGYNVDLKKNAEVSAGLFRQSKLSKQHILIISGEGERDAVSARGKKGLNVILTALEAEKYTVNFMLDIVSGGLLDFDSIALGKIKKGTYLCISPYFFNQALPEDSSFFKDTWVFLSASYSADDNGFANVFFRRGAAAVVGFQDKIDKDEALILTTNTIAFLGAGFELDQALRMAREASVKDGKPLKKANSLTGRKKDKDKGFYLFNPGPYNLSFDQENNVLTWDMNPAIWHRYRFEVVMEGDTIYDKTTEKSSSYFCNFSPKENGTYHWHVVASLLDDEGKVWASYKSAEKELVIDSIKELKPGHLVADPRILNYTDVPVNSYALMYVTITNTGEKPVTISAVEFEDPFSAYFELPVVIDPQSLLDELGKPSPTFSFWFTPKEVGSYSGDVVITSDAENPYIMIQVSGNAVVPSDRRIQLSPNHLNFRTYYLGDEPVWRSVQIDNIGEDPVTIKSVECPAGFRCDFEGEMVIPKYGVRFLNLYFDPSVAGSYSGRVIIDSDAGNGPHTLTVEGVAAEKPDDTVSVTGVSLNQTSLKIDISQTVQLMATVRPDNATNKSVTWISSADAVATVTDQGLVKGVSSGEAEITVMTEDGGLKATCHVTVKPVSGSHEGTNDENWD